MLKYFGQLTLDWSKNGLQAWEGFWLKLPEVIGVFLQGYHDFVRFTLLSPLG